MKTLLLCLALLAGPADTLRAMFWNLENFFDTRADSTSTSELEFTPRGERHWTRTRFRAKCNAVAKGVLWAATRHGGLPDIIGLAEVENSLVLRRLTNETALRKAGYKIVHYDSPDPRGIDVALLYRPSRLVLVDSKPCHIYGADSTIIPTRDILLARFETPSGEDLAVLVNHHPSKYGGVTVSGPRRKSAVERLRFLADSLQALECSILAMGDMNDTPDNPVYQILEPSLKNLALPLHRQGEGTIFYDGRWEVIDMYFIGPGVYARPMIILRIPFLMTRDSKYSTMKPLRTYSGPRYLGGASDHCPIWLEIHFGREKQDRPLEESRR